MNEAQRATLAETHRFLVWKAVRLIWPRVKAHIDRAELVSLGDLGLVEAASRWDPEAGVAFAVFAWYRVQGSIIDGLRKAAHIPRRVWAQLTALRAAGEYLEARARQEVAARTQGAAAPSGTAEKLREVKDAMAAIEAVFATAMRVSLDERKHTPEPEETLDARVDRSALRDRVDEALASLPDKERALVQKHYFEGKNLMEAGEELGISKSWASRLHAQAVDRLRRRLSRA
jgi:RNA polymerase sigma factor for flagellar operon FliA